MEDNINQQSASKPYQSYDMPGNSASLQGSVDARFRRASISIPLESRNNAEISQYFHQESNGNLKNAKTTIRRLSFSKSPSGSKMYALRIASIPGIYFSWNVAKSLIDGCPGAKYKGFFTIEACMRYIWEQFPSATFTVNETGDYIMDNPEPVYKIIEQARAKKEKTSGMTLTNDISSFEPTDPGANELLEQYNSDKNLRFKLNAAQENVLEAVKNNENVYINGRRSTGKDVLLSHISKYLATNNKTFHITTASVLTSYSKNMNYTLGWTGMGRALGTKKQILGKVRKNTSSRKVWAEADTLIVLDCTMLSSFMVDIMDFLGREIRRQQKSFGGLQMIFIGDEFGLGPVPVSTVSCPNCGQTHKLSSNNTYSASTDIRITCSNEDCGNVFSNSWMLYFFESNCWDEAKFKYFILEAQYNVDDGLIKLAESVRNREHDPESLRAKISQLKKHSHTESTTVCQNLDDVIKINDHALQSLSGEFIKYEAKDVVLNNFDFASRGQQKEGPADEIVGLKAGARVLLIPKVGKEMIPATIVGFVTPTKNEFEEIAKKESLGFLQLESSIKEWLAKNPLLPQVKILKTGAIKRVDCSIYLVHSCRKAVAWRTQIPLRLAYAVPIYKCHKYFLESMTISGEQEWAPGHLMAALSMATSFSSIEGIGLNDALFDLNTSFVHFHQNSSHGSICSSVKSHYIQNEKQNSIQHNVLKRHSTAGYPAGNTKKRRNSKTVGGGGDENIMIRSDVSLDSQLLPHPSQLQRRHSYQPLTSFQEQQLAWINSSPMVDANNSQHWQRLNMSSQNAVNIPYPPSPSMNYPQTGELSLDARQFIFPVPTHFGRYIQPHANERHILSTLHEIPNQNSQSDIFPSHSFQENVNVPSDYTSNQWSWPQ